MLTQLSIRDLLIIDQLDLAFQPGLNVLTGETGAGKSILLDSLGFVLGWRGRADLVRAGKSQGEVTAVFALPDGHPGRAVLEDLGFEVEDEVILRRVNTAEGRKTAWINDRRASGEALRRLSETLLELQGQNDDKGLLDPKQHITYLDAYAGNAKERDAVRESWGAKRKAQQALDAALAARAEMQADEDFLRHAVDELTALDPQEGEDDALDARRRRMQAAERVRDDLNKADQALGLNGAEGLMSDAKRWLDGSLSAADGALDEASAALDRAYSELAEAQSELSRFIESLSFDPREIEEVEERLFAIRGLARKHQVQPDELPQLAETLGERLALLDGGEDRIAVLEAELRAADAAYTTAAEALHATRVSAGQALDAAMARELPPLKMDRAIFTTDIAPVAPGPSGTDAVTFLVSTNPGTPAGPLNKIASGGELSRFLLALKLCLAGEDRYTTMIFDEIDRGVGGATATAIGKRLYALAQNGQVLVVTHSPQVAALGDNQWKVEKRQSESETTTTVLPLVGDERVDEVARMLAGDEISDAARAAARALMVS